MSFQVLKLECSVVCAVYTLYSSLCIGSKVAVAASRGQQMAAGAAVDLFIILAVVICRQLEHMLLVCFLTLEHCI